MNAEFIIEQMISLRKKIHLFQTIFIIVIGSVVLFPSCKGSKKAKAKAEQEARLAKEKEEQRKRQEEEERLRKEALEKAKRGTGSNDKIEELFSTISSASNTESANAAIGEALNYFSGPDAPVLIIISKNGDDYDYDEPTTISKYLNYLKDQKKSFNKVNKAVYDDNGKIKELILTTK